MPLKKGSSQKTISSNIQEVMHSYERKGTIHNIKPKDKAHALRIAQRIAYETAGKAKRGKTNPLFRGGSNYPLGQGPGGMTQRGFPFSKKGYGID